MLSNTKSRFAGKALLKTLFFFLLAIKICIGQDITNTLAPGGVFTIEDTDTNTFFSLSQSNGTISLIAPLAGNQRGTIFKGTDRFIHTYSPTGTNVYNTFVGINSGNFTMSGNANSNTGVGYMALTSLTTGYYNTATGTYALYSNTTGFFNTATGTHALTNNTTGYWNTATGISALNQNGTGNGNTATGLGALYYNYNGNYNTATGFSALEYNTTGSYNTATGYRALWFNTTGNNNTALGRLAGSLITTGANNIAIGYDAQVPTNDGSNQIRLGNYSITYAGIQVAWTVTSDRRWKDNIKTSPLGLSFLSKLNPVSYTRKNDEKQRTEYGLIAQEVEEVLKEEGIENSAMITVTDEGNYELRYNDLIAPMIKAIQELKIKNAELEERLSKYEEIQTLLVEKLEQIEASEQLKIQIVNSSNNN